MCDDGWNEPRMFQHPNDDCKANAFWLRIVEVRGNLEHVPASVGFHTSVALSALQSAFYEADAVVADAERDELLKGSVTAHAFVRLEFEDLDRNALRRGFDGVCALVMFLATPFDARGAWSADELTRYDAAVQIVRQELHNRCLARELAELERLYVEGQGDDAVIERRIRSKHARIASNRIAIVAAERRLAVVPSPKRPPLRLVG